MKQLIFTTGSLHKSGTLSDLSAMPKDSVGVYDLMTGDVCPGSLNYPIANIAIAHNNGNNIVVYPEIDMKSLTVSFSEATPAVRKEVSFTVPATMNSGYGKYATVIVTKCGTVFNERNNFSFTVPVKDNFTAPAIADAIVEHINNNVAGMEYDTELLVEAEANSAKVTIKSTDDRFNFNVTLADELMGVPVTVDAEFAAPILDAAYIKDLMHRCRGGRGFQHADCKEPWELYKGENYNIPESVDYPYCMLTLRFAVPRKAAKQRDEVVYQVLHIVSINGSGGAGTDLKEMFSEFIVTNGENE